LIDLMNETDLSNHCLINDLLVLINKEAGEVNIILLKKLVHVKNEIVLTELY